MVFKYGKINKDELVNIPTPFVINDNFLTEDLFQLDFENGRYGLDVGWYSKNSGECFVIYIIKNHDWDNPVFSVDVFDKHTLEGEFLKALDMFYNLCEGNG